MVKGRPCVVFNGMCAFVCMSVVPLSSSVACDTNIIESLVDDCAGVGGDVTDSVNAAPVQFTSDVSSNGPNPCGVQSVPATSVPETVVRSSSSSATCKDCTVVPELPSGFRNLGNACLMNAVIQLLRSSPAIAACIRSHFHEHCFTDCTSCSIGRAFEGSHTALYRHISCAKGVVPGYRRGDQFDAHEFLLCLITQIEQDSSYMLSMFGSQTVHRPDIGIVCAYTNASDWCRSEPTADCQWYGNM